LNSELEPPAFAGAIPFTDRDAMVAGRRRASISSYRATYRMSMRTIPATRRRLPTTDRLLHDRRC